MTAVEYAEAAPSTPDPPDVSPPPRTTLPRRDATDARPSELRRLGGWSRDDVLTICGAGVSALSSTLLLFGTIAPLRGPLGFVVVAFVLFNLTYGFLVSLSDDRPAVIDRVMSVLMTSSAVIAVGALASVVLDTVWRGREVLFRTNFYRQDMSATGPLDPVTKGGITHAIVGSLLITALCLVVTVPLGIACAVFLNETRSRLAQLVRTVVDAMTALPSIVAGLFIFATFILIVGFERSGLAASMAVSIMMLPIIIRSADVVLRLVPGNLREASAALGALQWRTVCFVVLPTARSGLVTSVILGLARGVGETAPVLLTSGVTGSLNLDLTKDPMMSLPLAAFDFVRSPQPALVQRGFATAAVLMLLVLALFVVARIFGGRPAGHLSARQARRVSARSAKDMARFNARVDAAGAAS